MGLTRAVTGLIMSRSATDALSWAGTRSTIGTVSNRKRLLIVAHAPSDNTRRLFDAVVGGVRIPLSITSRIFRMLGQSRDLKALRNLDTTRSLATIFGFYTAPNYVFQNDGLLALAKRMGDVDQMLFPVDARQIDWSVYLRKIHLAGLNRYALKERKLHSLRSTKARKQAA